jgi:hypothetical protein
VDNLPPDVRRMLERGGLIHEKAIERYQESLLALADNLGRRVGASLGVDPDSVVLPDGDDGIMVGGTSFERRLGAMMGDGAALRASVMSVALSEIMELVEASGLDRSRSILGAAFADLAGASERTMAAAGLPTVGALDTTAAEALLGGYVEGVLFPDTVGAFSSATAQRIKRGLTANLTFQSMERLAVDIVDTTGASVNRATTEARTALAESHRFTQEVIRKSIDPDDQMFLAYIGPLDGATRGFCDAVAGKFFKAKEFNKLDNGQGVSPRIMGGGYNCRHRVLPMPGTADQIKALGLTRGTQSDITRANAFGRRRGRK